MSDARLVSTETKLLLEQARSGTQSAFGRLLQHHAPSLRWTVARRLNPKLNPRLDPSNVVQDVQQEVIRRFDDYMARRPMSFRLWLLKMAHDRLLNAERDHLAAGRRSAECEIPLPDNSSLDLAAALAGHEPTPSDEAMRHETVHKVRRSLAKLSETDREIVSLRVFENLSNREVATLLELKSETTKKRFARALLRLQVLFGQEGVTEEEL